MMEEALDGLLLQSSLLAPTTLIPTNGPIASDIKFRIKRKVNYSSMKNVFQDGRIDAIVNKRSDTRGASAKATVQLLLQDGKASNATDNSNSLIEVNSNSIPPAAAEVESKATQDFQTKILSNALTIRKEPPKIPKPKWHAPWELTAVVSGHLGWVRSIAFDASNEWFVTGAADNTIKIWDLAKCCAGAEGGLKLTLTGHISPVRGLAVSPRHPYLFSAGEDKNVMCWDLEYNKIIRHYYGHLQGVYCLSLHPTLDILFTGGRDKTVRMWDMRTKAEIHCLSGHSDAIQTIITNSVDPQVISGSQDSTIKLWDIIAGKSMSTLTHHKKGVRSICANPRELTFLSGSADCIKKWQYRDGKFLKNFNGHNSIVNSVVVNEDGVGVSSGDDGTMHFWDYETGYCFQKTITKAQPGSLEAECGIFASAFDLSGSRLITAEADKSVKIWKENTVASEESHPVDYESWAKECLALKNY